MVKMTHLHPWIFPPIRRENTSRLARIYELVQFVDIRIPKKIPKRSSPSPRLLAINGTIAYAYATVYNT